MNLHDRRSIHKEKLKKNLKLKQKEEEKKK